MTALASELDDRLLADEPVATETAPIPTGAGWGFVIGALVIGAGTVLVRTRMKNRIPAAWRLDDSGIDVIARKNLGAGGGLAIVEVEDGTGAVRRLLLGVGGGPPSLVSDLSSMADVDRAWDDLTKDIQESPPQATPVEATPVTAPREQTTPVRARAQAPVPDPAITAEVDQILARKAASRRPWAATKKPVQTASKNSDDDVRAEKARILVKQVLAARDGRWSNIAG
jgi:hypothetical protein